MQENQSEKQPVVVNVQQITNIQQVAPANQVQQVQELNEAWSNCSSVDFRQSEDINLQYNTLYFRLHLYPFRFHEIYPTSCTIRLKGTEENDLSVWVAA